MTIWHTRPRNILIKLQTITHPRPKTHIQQLPLRTNILQQRLHSPNSHLLILFPDIALPLRLQDPIRKTRRRRRFHVRPRRLRLVQKRTPQPRRSLKLLNRRTLRPQRIQQMDAHRITRIQIQQLQKLRYDNRQPAIPPRPQRACEIMPAVLERPAVEKEPRSGIEEIFEVHEELPDRFRHVVRPVKHFPDLRQRQDGHHQRVVPELARVGPEERHVLHAAVGRALEVMVGPFGPGVEPGEVGLVVGLLVDAGEGEEDGHGVDVLGGAAGLEARGEPVLDDGEVAGIAGEGVVLPDAVEADAVGPFPVVPAFGVYDTAIWEVQEEFAGCVLDIY